MRNLSDADNQELQRVLKDLLAQDVTITLREVARRHSLKYASAFTPKRNGRRSELIEEAQSQQDKARAKRNELLTSVSDQLGPSVSDQLGQARRKIQELEDNVRTLVAAHQLCVRAVAASGGMAALERYWKEYARVSQFILSQQAAPLSANVVSFEKP